MDKIQDSKQDNIRSYIHNIAENGGDINKKDEYGGTPLFYYTHEERIDTEEYYKTVELCFDLGANPNDIASTRDYILDRPETISFIARVFSLALEELDYEYPDKTKLNKALVRLVDLAAEYGADMNAPGKEGKRALCFAGSPELISALLHHGADPNLPCASFYLAEHLRTPLANSIYCLNPVKAKLLLEAGANITPDYSLFHILLDRAEMEGAISPRDKGGDIEPILKLVKLFARYGADLETQDENKETAFAKSCSKYAQLYRKHREPLKRRILAQFMLALAENGADVNAPDKHGQPAIELLPEELRKEIRDRVKYIRTVKDMTDCDSDFYER